MSGAESDRSGNSPTGSSPGSASPWDYPALAQATLSDMFPPELMKTFASLMPGMMPASSGSTDRNGGFPMSMASRPEEQSPMEFTTSVPADGQPVKESVSHNELSEWRQKQLVVMSKYMHTNTKGDQSGEVTSSELDSQPQDAPASSNSRGHMASPLCEQKSLADYRVMSGIYHLTEKQRERVERFQSYCSPESTHRADQALIEDVQDSIIASHLKHCYHQRPIINAASAELDAKEQVSIGFFCIRPT